jgi:hypothetical protein
MEDKKLDDLLMAARTSYRVPPEPAVEAIWQAVESEAFASRTAGRRPDWRLAGMVAAASLVVGLGVGRWSARKAATTVDAATAAGAPAPAMLAASASPYQRTTEEVLGRTAVLLAALRSSDPRVMDASQLNAQATRILGSVRLLLDSPASRDPRLQTLLLDLELTLALVARMQPARGETDLTLINEAIAERDIVPRIRSAVVDLSADGY